ncbi:MAG: hypothetical protein ACRD3A_09970 [Terriglobales bacterium]
MKLEDRTAIIYLSKEGQRVLSDLAGFVPEKRGVLVQRVQEADDKGLWIDYKLEDGQHLFLILWEYVEAVELAPESKEKGLK